MSTVEDLRAALASGAISYDNLIKLDALNIVQMETEQALFPNEDIAYGSAPLAYAHNFGTLLFTRPGLTIDEMIEAANEATGPHKDTVLQALFLTKEQMEQNRDNFLEWINTSFV